MKNNKKLNLKKAAIVVTIPLAATLGITTVVNNSHNLNNTLKPINERNDVSASDIGSIEAWNLMNVTTATTTEISITTKVTTKTNDKLPILDNGSTSTNSYKVQMIDDSGVIGISKKSFDKELNSENVIIDGFTPSTTYSNIKIQLVDDSTETTIVDPKSPESGDANFTTLN